MKQTEVYYGITLWDRENSMMSFDGTTLGNDDMDDFINFCSRAGSFSIIITRFTKKDINIEFENYSIYCNNHNFYCNGRRLYKKDLRKKDMEGLITLIK